MNRLDRNQIEVPKTYQIALEILSVVDVAKLLFQIPRFSHHPKGTNRPLLVLPGYATDDSIAYPLRKYLNFISHRAEGWNMGVNDGNVPRMMSEFEKRLKEFYAIHKEKVNLVGWSLGGYVAREVARDNPDLVHKVVSIGSPLFGGPKYTSIAKVYAERQNIDLEELENEIDERYKVPLTMPLLSIYSKKDNIVSWQSCIDTFSPNATNIEMDATHLGLILNPDVYETVARFLQE